MINYALSKLKRNGKGKVNCRFLIYGSVSITTLTSIRSGICDMGPHRPQSEPVLDIKYENSIAADNQREN